MMSMERMYPISHLRREMYSREIKGDRGRSREINLPPEKGDVLKGDQGRSREIEGDQSPSEKAIKLFETLQSRQSREINLPPEKGRNPNGETE